MYARFCKLIYILLHIILPGIRSYCLERCSMYSMPTFSAMTFYYTSQLEFHCVVGNAELCILFIHTIVMLFQLVH